MKSKEWECEKFHGLNAAHISINSTAVVELYGGGGGGTLQPR